ncbi:MAG: glycosyltransferase family 4 protein [Candidatus Eisenbacteria bacterium]|nr:glycosyltransferase family 4 protein [Candidatus Eisenbacteria bacterium]
MRIAITNPFFWPQVRRGSERFLDDLSRYLAARGHEVTVLATDGGGPRPDPGAPARHLLYPERRPPAWLGRRFTSAHVYAFQCRRDLARGDFDAVHCLSHFDAFAAATAGRTGAPFLYHSMGIPLGRYFRTSPLDLVMMRTALARARTVGVLSHFAADNLRRDFGVEGRLLPTPVDLDRFRLRADIPRDPATLLMVGALDEARKGAGLMLRAFAEVKRSVPEARLRLSGAIRPSGAAALAALLPPSIAADVEFLGMGSPEDLPRLYAEATVMVLPSVWEALGLVLLESLACGTPVVGANHAGIPDVIASPEVGVLFEPGATRPAATNVEGLARACVEALELARRPGTAGACRAQAEQFGWPRLGPRFEAVYAGMAGR